MSIYDDPYADPNADAYADPYANPYAQQGGGPIHQPPPDEPGSPDPGTPPSGGTPSGGGSIAYTGKANQALITAILGPGYTLANGQISWPASGPAGGAGPITASTIAVIDSMANPLAAGNYQAFFQALTKDAKAHQDTLTGGHYNGVLQAAGFHISPANQSGRISKIQTPNGNWVRVIEGDPTAGGKWTWVDQGAGGGGPGGPSPTSTSTLGNFVPPDFNAPTFTAPGPFEGGPDFAFDASHISDPGYEFAKTEGMRSMQNAAAGEGMLRSPALLKSLDTWNQGLAAQQTGNVFGRQLGTWQVNRAAKAQDYDRLWQNLLTNYQVGYNSEADKYNRSANTYSINANADNQHWAHLLSLYDISQRGLPKYTPSTTNPSSYGYTLPNP